MRPTCINPGCGKPCTPIKGRVGVPGVRYRVYCGNCHIASYTGAALPWGVAPYKQNACKNQSGHLGFPCATDHSLISDVRGKFHIDHIDGDSTNNDPANLQELCLNCHQEKGMRQGDYNGHRDTPGRDDKGKTSMSAVDMFDELFKMTGK